MWMPYTYEERIRWHQFLIQQSRLKYLDRRCYRLELRVSRLERQFQRSGDTAELRLERLRCRHELELLKIDIEDFERRAQSFLNPKPK